MHLPEPISTYFEANRRMDVEAMLAAFAPDATVRDERRTHHGRPALRRWIEEATVGNEAVATPTEAEFAEGRGTVVAEVAGNFSGSPVSLTFRFVLGARGVEQLVIS